MIKLFVMADLLLDTYDRFAVLYDLLILVHDRTAGSALAPSVNLSPNTTDQLLAFLLAQGLVKNAGSDTEFKITTLGSNFLRDFQGMRKFVS
jgi:predicted transcriptional regulator